MSWLLEWLLKVAAIGGLLGAYGWWLYKNRSAGTAALAVAPLLWFGVCEAVNLATAYADAHRTVAGYTHVAAWVSMNDNPHSESWQADFAGYDAQGWLALLLPPTLMLVLRVVSKWQLVHFALVGLLCWPMLLLVSCDRVFSASGSHEYFNQSELPPIGSRVDASGQLYKPPGNQQ